MIRYASLWVGALALACLLPATAQPIQPERRIVLLVDEIRQVRNLPAIVAERLGYFHGDGLDVTMMNVRDELPHAQLLADGRVDAVMAYYHHNIVNQSRGQQTESIVVLGVTPGVQVMVAKGAAGRLRAAEGLKGSRIIAGGDGSSKTTVAHALALSAGLALNDLARLPTQGRDQNAEALRDGRADLLVAPVPDGADYLRRGVAEVYLDLTRPETTRQQFGALFPSATVFMATDRVKAHPEIAQHLATAFVRALHYLNTHSAEEIAALLPKDFFGKDRDAALQALAAELPMFATDGRMPADGARFEWGVLAKADPRLAKVDVARTYTNAFVERALEDAR